MEQEQDDKLNISLSIGGQIFHFTVKREDEFYYREAQRKLSDRINFLTNTYPDAEYQNILIITALEAALDRERLLDMHNEQGAISANKIKDWDELLERVLNEK